MYVRFCDSSFYRKISSDKLERRSDKLIRVMSVVVLSVQNLIFTLSICFLPHCNLKFLSLNVCGLRSKLLIPEFFNYINQFDVISLSEMKLDDLDEIILQTV